METPETYPPVTDQAEIVTPEKLEVDFKATMPAVNEAAIEDFEKRQTEAALAPGKPAKPGKPELRDKFNVVFDPAIHRTKETGRPIKTKSGAWARRRGPAPGTKPGGNSEMEAAEDEYPEQFEDPEKTAQDEANRRALAVIIARSMDGVMVKLFSEGVAPTEEEKQAELGAWENYLRVKDVKDIPPGVALALMYSSRLMLHADNPSVRERLGLYWLWAKAKFWSIVDRIMNRKA